MKRKKGRMGWIPSMINTELEEIKSKEKVKKDSEAFEKMLFYAKIGKGVKTIDKLMGFDVINMQTKRRRKKKK